MFCSGGSSWESPRSSDLFSLSLCVWYGEVIVEGKKLQRRRRLLETERHRPSVMVARVREQEMFK